MEAWIEPSEGNVNDWPEDFEQENGNYVNVCVLCGEEFVGHKRRVFCRACAKTTSYQEGETVVGEA